jgi:hypothetical protein
MPISRKQGETKDEFIGRCIPIEVNSGKAQEQAAAICYAYWDEKQLSAVTGVPRLNPIAVHPVVVFTVIAAGATIVG